ncbi:hypothetical protein PSTEL_06070 [Paenibacillus stellifer]|uniref:Uncharacterized protein n=1 Tax=Paenibacillus stellifer TaxID=169760 RepID=A0A089LPC7_9BACL|nr:hypothetical protein PSTEL_06070 [Paenibacillus stellifer]
MIAHLPVAGQAAREGRSNFAPHASKLQMQRFSCGRPFTGTIRIGVFTSGRALPGEAHSFCIFHAHKG